MNTALEQLFKLETALRRIADHEIRSDRRQRGMVDRTEVEDLQRVATLALNELERAVEGGASA